jgi:hypothetical protein
MSINDAELSALFAERDEHNKRVQELTSRINSKIRNDPTRCMICADRPATGRLSVTNTGKRACGKCFHDNHISYS